ncbi:hypothetical protein C8R48DRAFT_770934 [Suillus tomentosus]|nr:hypothetical protein C8R48DRAFT_770934 [Suillus tomentosus]
MSDIPPPQSMIPPGGSPSYPELCYNDARNAYACNKDGAWVPHPGICKSITSHAFGLKYGEPQLGFSYKPPGTYALTPAKFQSNLDTAPPLQPSSSHVPLRQVPTNQMIDPALLPLPDSPNLDLSDAVTIAEAHGHTLAAKTAGSHRQVKGPRGKVWYQAKLFTYNAEDDDEVHARSDVKVLLDMVRQELPLGQHGWQAVYIKFGQWAKANGRPECKVTLLETNFKQLVKTMKPTGDGVCPPEVTCAHHIDQLINKRVGTRDLDDMEFDDIEDDDSNHSVISDQVQDELDHTSPLIQHTALACSTARTEAPIPRCNARGAAATDLLTCLSGALDPAAQHDRDEDCANHSFATGQLFGLRNCFYDAKHECDCAQLRIEMIEMTGSTHHRHIRMPKCKNLQQEWYPEGRGSVRWITDEGESTASKVPEAPKAPHLRRVGPSGHRKYSDHPYFEDLADEPPKPIRREGSQEI